MKGTHTPADFEKTKVPDDLAVRDTLRMYGSNASDSLMFLKLTDTLMRDCPSCLDS